MIGAFPKFLSAEDLLRANSFKDQLAGLLKQRDSISEADLKSRSARARDHYLKNPAAKNLQRWHHEKSQDFAQLWAQAQAAIENFIGHTVAPFLLAICEQGHRLAAREFDRVIRDENTKSARVLDWSLFAKIYAEAARPMVYFREVSQTLKLVVDRPARAKPKWLLTLLAELPKFAVEEPPTPTETKPCG